MADTYSVGSLSDLITGTNTPNKRKVVKKEFKGTLIKPDDVGEQNVEKSPKKGFKSSNKGFKSTNKGLKSPNGGLKSPANSVPKVSVEKKRKSTVSAQGTPLKKRKHSADSLSRSIQSADEDATDLNDLLVESMNGNVNKKGKKKQNSTQNGDADETNLNNDVSKKVNDSMNDKGSKKGKKRKSLKLKSTQNGDEDESNSNNTVGVSINDSMNGEGIKKGKKRKSSKLNSTQSGGEDTTPKKKAKSNSGEEEGTDKEVKTQFEENAERRIKNKNKEQKQKKQLEDPEITARTLFIGNVPLTAKKQEMKKLFSKYGVIEAVRFRAIAVEDPKTSKKVAFITKSFHKERTSCVAYIRFANVESTEKALEANGLVFKEHHLVVDKCKTRKKADESKAIFVGNIAFNAEEEDLWKLFSSCGPIENVRLIRDKKTLIGKGFGYINFKTSDAVHLALEMGEVKYKDRVLRLSLCNLNAAKKNKKRNKVKKISEPGKPKARRFKKKGKTVEGASSDSEPKEKLENTNGSFQGSKIALKTKKNKPNKGLLQKKKMAKKIAPKPKDD